MSGLVIAPVERPAVKGIRPATAAVLLLLAGCGGDEPPAEPPRALTEVEQVAEVIRKQSAAVAAGDGRAACSYFSPRVVREIDRLLAERSPDIPLVCADALSEVASRLPERVVAQLKRPALVSVKVEGDRATAVVDAPEEVRRLAERAGRPEAVGGGTPLRKIGGRWKVDALRL